MHYLGTMILSMKWKEYNGSISLMFLVLCHDFLLPNLPLHVHIWLKFGCFERVITTKI